MLESRASYGYYGVGYGATGENEPKRYKGGYTMNTYHFLIDWHDPFFSNRFKVAAKSFENAERAAKAYARKNGGTFLGEDPEHIRANH